MTDYKTLEGRIEELQDRYNALDSLLVSTLETNQALGKRLREGVGNCILC